jgi:hypothetical protein
MLVIWGSLFPVERPVPWYKILYQGDTEISIMRSYLKAQDEGIRYMKQ